MLKKWLRERKRVEDDAGKSEKGTIDAFPRVNMAIKVFSETLQENLYLVSNEGMQKYVSGEKLVSYLPHEIEHLIKLQATPDVIKKIHKAKELFVGSEIEPEKQI